MSGVHLIIFCAEKYKQQFLEHCLFSIKQNVKDEILSKTIITDQKFSHPDATVIEDNELWNQIDPGFQYRQFWDDKWTRQQILKLSTDLIASGDILIVDVDVFFIKPIQFVTNNRYNIYTAIEHDPYYFKTLDFLLGIGKQISESFITDFAIFNSDILKKLKKDIREKHGVDWLKVLSKCLTEHSSTYSACILSEYETYGSYLYVKFQDKINQIIQLGGLNILVYTNSPDIGKIDSNRFLQILNLHCQYPYVCCLLNVNENEIFHNCIVKKLIF